MVWACAARFSPIGIAKSIMPSRGTGVDSDRQTTERGPSHHHSKRSGANAERHEEPPLAIERPDSAAMGARRPAPNKASEPVQRIRTMRRKNVAGVLSGFEGSWLLLIGSEPPQLRHRHNDQRKMVPSALSVFGQRDLVHQVAAERRSRNPGESYKIHHLVANEHCRLRFGSK